MQMFGELLIVGVNFGQQEKISYFFAKISEKTQLINHPCKNSNVQHFVHGKLKISV